MLYTIYIHTPHIANNWRLHAGVISYEAIPGELSMNLRLRSRIGKTVKSCLQCTRIHHPQIYHFLWLVFQLSIILGWCMTLLYQHYDMILRWHRVHSPWGTHLLVTSWNLSREGLPLKKKTGS